MVQAVINGQSAQKQELLKRFDKVDKRILNFENKIDIVEKNLTKRIDNIGKSVAYL